MDLRASDADREATVERLRVASMEGRLDSDELEERLQAAYAARFCQELAPLTADITPPRPAVAAGPVRPVFVQPASTNALAIISLVCAIVWFGWIGSLAAVVFGHVALSQIKGSGGRQRGRGLAIAGLAIGYLWLVMLPLWLFFALGF